MKWGFVILLAALCLPAWSGAQSYEERMRTNYKVPREEWLTGLELMMCRGGRKSTVDGQYHCKHNWVTHIYDSRDMFNKSIMSITNSGLVVIEELRERYGPETTYNDSPTLNHDFARRWGLTDPDESCTWYVWEMSKIRVTVLNCIAKTITTLTDKTYENIRRSLAEANRTHPRANPPKQSPKPKRKSKPKQQGVPRRD